MQNRLAWFLQRKQNHPVKLQLRAPAALNTGSATYSNGHPGQSDGGSPLLGGFSLDDYTPGMARKNPYSSEPAASHGENRAREAFLVPSDSIPVLMKPKRAPPESRSEAMSVLIDSRKRKLEAPVPEQPPKPCEVLEMIQVCPVLCTSAIVPAAWCSRLCSVPHASSLLHSQCILGHVWATCQEHDERPSL